MPVCLCLCTFIEIRKGTKNLDFVMCTVVYIGLGKTSVTIWTIGSLENWGNHWRKWTILRSFRATWVTLPDCIGGVTWQHISGKGKEKRNVSYYNIYCCSLAQQWTVCAKSWNVILIWLALWSRHLRKVCLNLCTMWAYLAIILKLALAIHLVCALLYLNPKLLYCCILFIFAPMLTTFWGRNITLRWNKSTSWGAGQGG